MKYRSVYLGLVLAGVLLVFGVWALSFFSSALSLQRVALDSEAAAKRVAVPSGQALFNPPRPEDAPESIREEVMLGYRIMTETKKYAGQYIGKDSQLSCSSCHFEGGRSMESFSLVGVGATYPRYRDRNEYTIDLGIRIQGCFDRSMNGTPPPLDSQVIQSLLVYLQWISKDIPVYADLPWALPESMDNPHKPDPANGGKVYKNVCARCHGLEGEGTDIAPPVWGDGAYNDGAGMHRIRTLSIFAWRFMPKNAPSLTQEEALDVAGYIHEQPRPAFKPTHSDKIVRLIPLTEGN